MILTILSGGLLDQEVDVIVNAWNRNIIPWWLLLPQGVSGAIKRRGGTGPFQELRKHGAIPLGGVVLTSAGGWSFFVSCARCAADFRHLPCAPECCRNSLAGHILRSTRRTGLPLGMGSHVLII